MSENEISDGDDISIDSAEISESEEPYRDLKDEGTVALPTVIYLMII